MGKRRLRLRTTSLAAVIVATTLSAACGSSSSPGTSTDAQASSPGAGATSTLTVLGAASLSKVFPIIGTMFSAANPGVTVRFSFAGTDALAAQIEEGAPADVFAGASTKYGDQLSGETLIDTPVPFCTNTLVLIVPSDNPAGITSLTDLTTAGIKLVIGSETVPIGTYTRTVLSNLDSLYGAGYSDDVLKNVVSEEDSVTSIVAKVQLGEADAGFVYVTDAMAAGSKVTSIDIPEEGQAVATYPIAVVKATKDAAASQRFVDFVLSPAGQSELRKAGFGPPPSS